MNFKDTNKPSQELHLALAMSQDEIFPEEIMQAQREVDSSIQLKFGGGLRQCTSTIPSDLGPVGISFEPLLDNTLTLLTNRSTSASSGLPKPRSKTTNERASCRPDRTEDAFLWNENKTSIGKGEKKLERQSLPNFAKNLRTELPDAVFFPDLVPLFSPRRSPLLASQPIEAHRTEDNYCRIPFFARVSPIFVFLTIAILMLPVSVPSKQSLYLFNGNGLPPQADSLDAIEMEKRHLPRFRSHPAAGTKVVLNILRASGNIEDFNRQITAQTRSSGRLKRLLGYGYFGTDPLEVSKKYQVTGRELPLVQEHILPKNQNTGMLLGSIFATSNGQLLPTEKDRRFVPQKGSVKMHRAKFAQILIPDVNTMGFQQQLKVTDNAAGLHRSDIRGDVIPLKSIEQLEVQQGRRSFAHPQHEQSSKTKMIEDGLRTYFEHRRNRLSIILASLL